MIHLNPDKGIFGYDNGFYGSGLRPMVCLKSNVVIEEQGNNKYIIK